MNFQLIYFYCTQRNPAMLVYTDLKTQMEVNNIMPWCRAASYIVHCQSWSKSFTFAWEIHDDFSLGCTENYKAKYKASSESGGSQEILCLFPLHLLCYLPGWLLLLLYIRVLFWFYCFGMSTLLHNAHSVPFNVSMHVHVENVKPIINCHSNFAVTVFLLQFLFKALFDTLTTNNLNCNF